jgi:hypothetical protein
MSNFVVPLFFIGFFLYTVLPMVLSNEPDKKCHELINSSQFTEMVNKLHGQVPIEKSPYQHVKIWDENGVVNYSELLTAMKNLMIKVKNLHTRNFCLQ